MNQPDINYYGGDWAIFKAWLHTEQQDTYKILANPACSVADTEQARGRNLLIEMMLDFGPPADAANPGR